MTGPLLTREQILEAVDVGEELVAVPEWGGTVRVVGLTGDERDAFEAQLVSERQGKTHIDLRQVRAKLAAAAVRDEAGVRIFSQADVDALGRKSAAALQRVFKVAQRLSGLSDEEAAELAGNSAGGPAADSPSD